MKKKMPVTDETTEIDVDELKHETEKAWLVIIAGDEYWMPKSQCELDKETMVLTIPEWLAKKNELIDE